MRDRERFLIRLALTYLKANLDDAVEAFEEGGGCVKFESVLRDTPTEDELERLIQELKS